MCFYAASRRTQPQKLENKNLSFLIKELSCGPPNRLSEVSSTELMGYLGVPVFHLLMSLYLFE